MAERGRARPPMAPQDGWLSDGRHVLQFKPARWNRYTQELDLISGEWLPGEPVPLLKRRRRLRRDAAIQLWREKLQQGWTVCPPQWTLPALPATKRR